MQRIASIQLLLLLSALSLVGCKRDSVSAELSVKKGTQLLSAPAKPTAVARRHQLWAFGYVDGKIVVLAPKAQPITLSPPPKVAPSAKKDANPADGGAATPESDPAWGAIHDLELSDDGRLLLVGAGKMVALYGLPSGRLEARLSGPQEINRVSFEQGAKAGLFGTTHGYVLRWTFGKTEADAVKGFVCHPMEVPKHLRKAEPTSKRCPFGSYFETRDGKSLCAYPVTHLLRRGAQIARACRTGFTAVLDSSSKRVRHLTAGALAGLDFIDDDTLMLLKAAGPLSVYDLKKKEVERAFSLAGKAKLLSAHGPWFVASYGKALQFGHRQAGLLERITLKQEPVWLELGDELLDIVLEGGQVIRYPLDQKIKKPQ